MLEEEFHCLLQRVATRRCEEKTLEIKAAGKECPERLYDTFSSFSNQDDGGIILFGVDEQHGFEKIGVYNAQDLQKKLMEVGETMTPPVRPTLSVFEEDGRVFVTAEIAPIDVSERPCFKTAKGRLKGSYIRVGDADKPMTEYEVYSYEAFRRQTRDDLRPAEGVPEDMLDVKKVAHYILLRKERRPNLETLSDGQMYELSGITRNGTMTLAAVLLFSVYPQAYYPQLSIIASCIPGTAMGCLNASGQRFTDSRRIEGTLSEMLDEAIRFVKTNMRTAIRIDPETGVREDTPDYPIEAVREAVLNALIHRDYSVHTENMPIQLLMYSDRLEVRNPGGLYGRMTVDQLGKIQPNTRNPMLVTAMEVFGQSENRYSGIHRIRRAMAEMQLPPPVFCDSRGEFSVCFYKKSEDMQFAGTASAAPGDDRGIVAFCSEPRTRAEIASFLNMKSVAYVRRRYIEPLLSAGMLKCVRETVGGRKRECYQAEA